METGVVSLRFDPFAQGVLEILSSRGWVRLVEVQSGSEVLSLCREFGTAWAHRDADERGVTTLTNLNRHSVGDRGFSAEALPLHTDASSEALPPELVLLWCDAPPATGGNSVLSDGLEIYRILSNEDRNTIATLEAPCQTLLGGGKMRISPLFDCVRKGWRFLRHRRDELVSVVPGASAAVARFIEVSDRLSVTFSLNRGEGYILNNGRILHGREAYSGVRTAHRILVSLKDVFAKGSPPIDRGFSV